MVVCANQPFDLTPQCVTGKVSPVKALVKSREERGLWLEDVPEPEMGINDVKIRVLATGICGTDLHIYDWDAWARSTIRKGLTIGHEFVGEVVATGSHRPHHPHRPPLTAAG